MGFLLRILEDDGAIVEQVIADKRFNPVRSGFTSSEFPILGMLDPYGDTYLNHLQCELLEAEIQKAGPRLEQSGVSSNFRTEIIRLCRVSRAKPQRRFVFIGD